MKRPTPALLLFSILGNLALGVWLLGSAPASKHASAASPSSAAVASTAVEAVAKLPSTLDAPITRGTWAELHHGSDADFAQRLRAEGFPSEIIRTLLRERIRLRFKDKLIALKAGAKDEYWRRRPNYTSDASLSPQARATRRAIDREINDAVKTAMGTENDSPNPHESAKRARQYGTISREKADQLAAIERDYTELSQGIREGSGPIQLRSDREQLRLLDREKRADLAAVLTPDELLEYDLRSSPAANTVRNRLTYFEPSEDEYRALTQIQLEFDREYGSINLTDAEEARRRTAESELLSKMQATLTPERAREFQLVTDQNFQRTARALRDFNYDSEVTREVVTLQRSMSDRAKAIQEQSGSTEKLKSAQLESLYREAHASLSGKLSPAALEAYKQRAGRWLEQLKSKRNPSGARS